MHTPCRHAWPAPRPLAGMRGAEILGGTGFQPVPQPVPTTSPACLPRTASPSRARVVLLAPVFLAAIVGCAATQPHEPSTQPASQPALAALGNAELVAHVENMPWVTAEPAYRLVYIVWKGTPHAGTFDELADELRSGRVISRTWRHEPDSRIDRAQAGYMICRSADIRSGANWLLTGLGRYAWRELNYLGIADPPSEYGLVKGGQFTGIVRRALEYRRQSREHPGEAFELGPRPD